MSMGEDLRELYDTGRSNKYTEVSRNKVLKAGFSRAVMAMQKAGSVEDLKRLSFLHYEQLKYEYSGYSSVRLSNSYVHRLIFLEHEDGIELELIEIDDTHYGNR